MSSSTMDPNASPAAAPNLSAAILAGLVAAIAGAIIWAAVTAATEHQIGWMAIGVGFVVGYAVRVFGRGHDVRYQALGAAFALLGCVLGNLLTVVYFIAANQEMGFMETLGRLDLGIAAQLMTETFDVMDILFYGIAMYFGFAYSRQPVAPVAPPPAA